MAARSARLTRCPGPDRRWSTRAAEDAEPRFHVEFGDTGFVDGRHTGQTGKTLRTGDHNGANASVVDECLGSAGVVKKQINAAALQIQMRRLRPAIRHMHHFHAGDMRQHRRRDVLAGAHAAGGVG